MITETFTKKDMPRIMAVIAGFFTSCDDKQYTPLGIPTYDEMKLQQLLEQWGGDSD